MKRLLLLLTEHDVTVYRTGRGGMSATARFEADEAGRTRLASWLRTQSTHDCVFLLDVGGEAFQLETLPVLGRRDRRAYLERQRSRPGASTRYGMLLIQNGADGRERLLRCALADESWLDAWLDAVESAGQPLSGVLSVSLLIAELPRSVGVTPGLCAVYTPSRPGKRQTLVDRDGLVLSRLLPALDSRLAMLKEAERASAYLASQISMPEPPPLTLLDVDSAPEEKAHVAEGERLLRVTPAEILRSRGLKAGDDTTPQVMFAHLALGCRAGNHYAPAQRLRLSRLRRLRRRVLAACGAVLAVSALVIPIAREREASARSAAAALLDQTTRAEAQALESRRRLGRYPLAAEHVRLAVELHRRHVERWPPLHDSLMRLSRVLARHPDLRLHSLDWMVQDGPDRATGMPEAGTPAAGTPAAGTPAAGTPAAGVPARVSDERPAASGATWPDRRLVITLSGSFHPVDGSLANHRRAAADVQRLRDDLAASGQVLRWTGAPLTTSSEGSTDALAHPPAFRGIIVIETVPGANTAPHADVRSKHD